MNEINQVQVFYTSQTVCQSLWFFAIDLRFTQYQLEPMTSLHCAGLYPDLLLCAEAIKSNSETAEGRTSMETYVSDVKP